MDFTKAEVTDYGVIIIKEENEVISIYPDSANSDYQRYLRWLENPESEEGGTL